MRNTHIPRPLTGILLLTLTACGGLSVAPTPTPAPPTPEVMADCFLSFNLAAWIDADGDGAGDAGEPPLEGVLMTVEGPFAQVFEGPTVRTDSEGLAHVSGWQPGGCLGEFTISAEAPPGYTRTTEPPAPVPAGSEAGQTFDFGFRPTEP